MSSEICPTDKPTSCGFLSGYIESNIELPPDGLNGECIVHYSGEHSNCEMRVMLSRGKRKGIGTIMKDGVPFIQIEYHYGMSNSPVYQLDNHGKVVLKGELINGVEHGLFVEYGKRNKVIWRGYYRNGVRYSELTKSDTLDGFYDERSVFSNSLLTTAQYDDSLHDKNGRCFEYENGSLKSECVYDNGLKKHIIREFVDGEMILYGSYRNKVYEGAYYGDKKSGFLCHEPMEGMNGFFKEVDFNHRLVAINQYDETNIYRNGKCFQLENGSVKRVCFYHNDRLVRIFQEFNGSTMIQYNRHRNLVYEGGFIGDMKNGFMREGKGNEIVMNGKVKRVCVYKKGRVKRVLQEFNGLTMTEYNSSGKKSYEGEYGGNRKNGFVRNGYGFLLNMNGNDKAFCLYKNGRLIRMIFELNGYEMTELDDNERMRYMSEFKGNRKNGFKRNGRGYYFDENGVLKQYCLIENGVVKRVIQEFNGSTMIEYDDNEMMSYMGEWKGEWKGDMKSGLIREGFGTEYHNGHVLYMGEWSNGDKKETGGKMNSIALWSDGKLFYEVDRNFVVKRGYWYENDERKQSNQERELFHMILSRRIDSQLMNSIDNSLFCISLITTGDTFGVIRLNRYCLSIDWLSNSYMVIMVDMVTKNMIVFRNGKWIVVQYSKEIIDLDANGRRWEGSIINGKPFGYGVIYDEEGRIEYEGFVIDNKKACYGIEYYSDIGRVKYEGCYHVSRFGKGVLYDRNGVVEYDGLWKDDEPYSSSFDGRTIDSQTESIAIPSKSFNESELFTLHSFIHSLKRLMIGDDCFGSVRLFELDGLSELESVVIGKFSFTIGKDWNIIKTSERSDGACRIVNCPTLQSIRIGDYSFGDYHSFELSNLPSLQSIDIGRDCFEYTPSFSLIGLIDWLV